MKESVGFYSPEKLLRTDRNLPIIPIFNAGESGIDAKPSSDKKNASSPIGTSPRTRAIAPCPKLRRSAFFSWTKQCGWRPWLLPSWLASKTGSVLVLSVSPRWRSSRAAFEGTHGTRVAGGMELRGRGGATSFCGSSVAPPFCRVHLSCSGDRRCFINSLARVACPPRGPSILDDFW